MALLKQIKRCWVEGTFLTLIILTFAFLPPIKNAGLELLLFKVLLFSASQLHAIILRKWIFGYIDFESNENRYQLLMVIAIHVMAAYVYGIGG